MTTTKKSDELFPTSAFFNINHLGLSEKYRFNAKQTFLRSTSNFCKLIGIQELHASSATAQDCFFSHFSDFAVLYNVKIGCLGQCIMIDRSFLARCGIAARQFENEHDILEEDCPMDNLSYHHLIFISGVAHAFWWQDEATMHLFINIYWCIILCKLS